MTLQTRAQCKKAMKQLEQNQAALRGDMNPVKGNMEEMNDKMYQLTRVITNMIEREAETDKRKVASMSTPPPVDGNPLQGFTSDTQGGEAKNDTPHPEGSIPTIVHNGASCPIQIPIPRDNYVDLSQQYEDEDHRGMVQESKPATHPASTIGILEERLKGHTPFDIPYQQVETPAPFQILFPMSSQTSVQIPVPIPFKIPVKSEDHIVFHVPSLFPFENTKSVPWNYNSTIYVGDKPIVLEPGVTNITRIGGMTQSGKVFAPKQQSKRNTPEGSKDKEVESSKKTLP
ncbi:hypothetical protein KIW84_020545 [Lathyrus oleraceus]|uniref:Uncharacterized protein n=1 Tax=Pisum sativum TaxID=3888 RepID=A0A9D4Y6N2_PEA|nr:hypothetical protein KIW84_020545 [Pisum sativum]